MGIEGLKGHQPSREQGDHRQPELSLPVVVGWAILRITYLSHQSQKILRRPAGGPLVTEGSEPLLWRERAKCRKLIYSALVPTGQRQRHTKPTW
jgi:hypothetical protein